MSPRELLAELRARGVELRLAEDCRHVLYRRANAEDCARIKNEKLWILMLLVHQAGADMFDPKIAFLASAERGLTHRAICDRMRIAFGISDELAEALIDLGEKAGFLRRRGEVLEPVGDLAAVFARDRELLPA